MYEQKATPHGGRERGALAETQEADSAGLGNPLTVKRCGRVFVFLGEGRPGTTSEVRLAGELDKRKRSRPVRDVTYYGRLTESSAPRPKRFHDIDPGSNNASEADI